MSEHVIVSVQFEKGIRDILWVFCFELRQQRETNTPTKISLIPFSNCTLSYLYHGHTF